MNCQSSIESVPIPKTKKDITKKWLVNATGLHPIEDTIAINENIQEGVGFLSNICRVSFKTETGSEESILVKLLPDNQEFRELTMYQGFDKTEITFYQKVHLQIVEVSPELKDNFCTFYGGKHNGQEEGNDYASMLILGDLKPSGYVMLNPQSHHWRENLTKVIKFIAELNVAGLAIKEFKPEEFSKIKSVCLNGMNEKKLGMLFDLAEANSTKLDELLGNFNIPEEIRNWYKKVTQNVRKTAERVFLKGNDFPCLLHGDIWPPNILINESSSNSHVKIIDWQLLSYRDATCELAPTILSCLPLSHLSKGDVEVFLKMYWKEFIEGCKAKGIDYKERNEEEFLQFFNTWGMAYGYHWMIFSIDSFPNDRERLGKIFEVICKDYNTPKFLCDDLDQNLKIE